jgi:hypothetical protein
MAFRRYLLFVTSVLLTLILLAPSATTRAAGTPNPGVLPPTSSPHGLTYAQWSGRWWQWALSIPLATNPLVDTTGAHCGVGQTGHVWFLAGLGGGLQSATRSCTVPAGTMLFFPVANTECDTSPPITPYTPAQWLAICPGLIASFVPPTVNSLAANVDGMAIQGLTTSTCPQVQGSRFVQTQPSYCVGSTPFTITVQTDNGYPAVCGCTEPAGTYQGVDEGVYVMLAPLSAGSHTIHFQYQFGTSGLSVVTCRITVAG